MIMTQARPWCLGDKLVWRQVIVDQHEKIRHQKKTQELAKLQRRPEPQKNSNGARKKLPGANLARFGRALSSDHASSEERSAEEAALAAMKEALQVRERNHSWPCLPRAHVVPPLG